MRGLKMKEKYKTILMFISIIAIFAISLSVANNNQIVSTSADASNSKTIGWGIKEQIIICNQMLDLKIRKC